MIWRSQICLVFREYRLTLGSEPEPTVAPAKRIDTIMDRLARWIESGDTRAEFTRVDKLTHPDAAQAIRFWQERPADGIRIGRDVPSRSIARLLSRIVVYEPVEGGADFKVHLAGSGVRRRFARDITGKTMAQLFSAEDLPARVLSLKYVLSRNEARMTRIIHRAGGVEVMKIELFQVPVTAPNGIDRWVLTFGFHF